VGIFFKDIEGKEVQFVSEWFQDNNGTNRGYRPIVAIDQERANTTETPAVTEGTVILAEMMAAGK
jgi:hypothetical protein